MKIVFSLGVISLCLYLAANSMRNYTNASTQGFKQRQVMDSTEDALVVSQAVRAAFDTAAARPVGSTACPEGTADTIVDSVHLCWPSNAGGCFVSGAENMKYCLASDQRATQANVSPTGGAGGATSTNGTTLVGGTYTTTTTGAVPVNVVAPNCTTTPTSCLNCTAAGTSCFSIVLCIGPSADAGCSNGTKVVHSFGFRN